MMKLQKTSSIVISRSKEEAAALLTMYNPSEQSRYAAYPERCVTGKAPVLSKIKYEYGEMVVVDWLTLELNDYQNFLGVKEDNKATYEIIRETAKMIMNRYYYLKLSEIMLFFQKLKYGDYGELYGRVDTVRILRSLRQFIVDRNNILDIAYQKQREQSIKESKGKAISREEYEKLKKI